MEEITFLNSSFLLIFLCFILVILATYIIFEKKLLNIVFASSAFSAIISCCYIILDSPDVAMTEVALGAALSTTLLLNVVKIINYDSNYITNNILITHTHSHINGLFIFGIIIIAIIFVISAINLGNNITEFGDSNTMLHKGVSNYYITNTYTDTHVASMVAAILASYRGYDTLGETLVIFLAAISVTFIMFANKNSQATKLHLK